MKNYCGPGFESLDNVIFIIFLESKKLILCLYSFVTNKDLVDAMQKFAIENNIFMGNGKKK